MATRSHFGALFLALRDHILEDVKKIIDFVNQKWPQPILLIGHSAGATSVGYLATVLKDRPIDGVVFTGVVGEGSFATVPLHNISYPALFIHHKEDPCVSFEAALRQHHRLINSPRVNFVEVSAGDRSREINCSPIDPSRGTSWAHGFSGKEREVAIAITDWVTGKPVPDRIGP